VIVVDGWLGSGRLLLYRSEKPALGDSGWVLAAADDLRGSGPVDVDALGWLRVDDLLSVCGTLEPLLDLPFNTGVVFGVQNEAVGRSIAEVIDERRGGARP